MEKVTSINSKLRLELAATILSGMLSDWDTLTNSTPVNSNIWRSAPKTALRLAQQLIDAEKEME